MRLILLTLARALENQQEVVNNSSLKTLLISTICLSIQFACTEGETHGEEKWDRSEWVSLVGESIQFRKPDEFKRTSRYRIREDLAELKVDTLQLKLLENSLENLEFEDSEVDVFIDTTTNYRILVICNIERIDFSNNDATKLKSRIQEQNSKLKNENPSLNFGNVNGTVKRNQNLSIAKYATVISNTMNSNRINRSIYFVTSDEFTLVVYEFSDNPKAIEMYLWTVKI